MHVMSSWAMGGTEKMLTHLIPHFDQTKFESCLVCFNSLSPLSHEWQKAGIEVIHLNMDKRVSPLGTIRLMRVIKERKPDIMMVYGLRANLMARFAAFFCHVPVFITGQRGIEDWKSKFEVMLEKFTSCFVDLYIGNSQACCDMLAKRERIPAYKLCTIPNGIDISTPPDIEIRSAKLKSQFNLPSDSVLIGSVGRLQPVKGHEYFLKAAKILLETKANLYFVLVGQDHRNGYLQQLASDLKISNKVCFAGYSTEIAAWLNCFDIFVLPSLSEGMPVAVIEAMFLGKAVVATDAGGTSEVVDNENTGLLVPAAEPCLSHHTVSE